MMDRVHAALDGELRRDDLTENERAELRLLEAAVDDVVISMRAVSAPDLTAAVMDRLPPPRNGHTVVGALLEWIWTPRTLALTVRPAHALGGLVAAALAGLALTFGTPAAPPLPVAVTEPETPALYVQFRFENASATHVELAGSFTEWQPSYEMEETAPGVWSVMVPLTPGVHDYTFVVDGEEWVVDPNAPRVPDSFGGSNSRLFLPAPTDAA